MDVGFCKPIAECIHQVRSNGFNAKLLGLHHSPADNFRLTFRSDDSGASGYDACTIKFVHLGLPSIIVNACNIA